MGTATTILQTIVFRGEVAGNIVSWEQSDECNVGYWLGKKFWGQGITSATLSSFVKQVTKRPLYDHVSKHNTALLRVLQKCGFSVSCEGAFADVDGEESDEYIMMLA